MTEHLFGKTLKELEYITKEVNLPKYTAKQIADWLYKKNIKSVDEMTNLSKKAREILKERYDIGLKEPVSVQTSSDGTKKYLFKTGKNYIEAAYIPANNRATLCVSSQAGCKYACEFCMTGRQGFQAHLSANEILNQIKSLPEFDKLTNIVYMGMGEPFDNLDEVLKSTEILTADWGFAWSPKRITVSTNGIIKGLKRFLKESKCHLAISIHTPFAEERLRIMPVEKTNPIKDVLKIVKNHDFGRQRRISFEYIVFKDFNDDKKHADELARLVFGFYARVNLIRFHEIPGTDLKGTDYKTLEKFRDRLNEKGITATIRASRGQDIDAACGLLSTKELKAKN
ncbi:MAG: 23S rRNA (adenine(2503)-C(2))-methyltransferase RlmN [Chlorobi bacterium]|nr:23S rRNA (adenine(2503)-C(2))-methyltransferase RlmN [Chlorobiota bacterium]